MNQSTTARVLAPEDPEREQYPITTRGALAGLFVVILTDSVLFWAPTREEAEAFARSLES